ncbi:MAG: CPBP family intramembrane metalloprotease domain-containing protein [Methanoregula sp.]|nr:MAG: CPBP family intramembrane metalloprotease domain-containing protein [Methanoregula sp.]
MSMIERLWQSRYRNLLIAVPVIVFFLIVLALSGSEVLGGDLGEFVLAGGMVAPFVILAFLAYTGEEYRWARYTAVLWLLLILFCIWAVTFIVTLAPVISLSGDEAALDAYLETQPPESMGLVLLVSLGAVLACLLGFFRRFRGLLSRVLPFNPDSFAHTIGLVCVIALIVLPVVPLAVTGNAPFLDAGLQKTLGIGSEEPGSSVKLDLFTLIWTTLASFFFVGLWVRKDLPATLLRLGLVQPSARQVALGIGAGLLLVGAFTVIDDLLVQLFIACGITVTDEALVSNLFIVSFTPLAAIVASVTAGLGEELSVRGVIQPRFGILLAALVFASLHAYQYAWDGVIEVFLIGLCFGVLRQYTNTSTSAIAHGVYDLVLFSLIMAGITSI